MSRDFGPCLCGDPECGRCFPQDYLYCTRCGADVANPCGCNDEDEPHAAEVLGVK